MKPTESELGWLAGIMDGEGTIALYSRPGKTRDYMFAHFGFASTDASIIQRGREILQKLTEDTKAIRIHPMPRKHLNSKWKDALQLRVEKQVPLREVLLVVTPYLVAKKKNAEIVLEWLDGRVKFSRSSLSESDGELLSRSRNVMNFNRSA